MLPIRGDPTLGLARLTRKLVHKYCRSATLAALAALLFFLAGFVSPNTHPELATRHLIATGLFFLACWTVCRLFSRGVDRRLQLEDVNRQTAGPALYAYVVYLETIKHTVGVSFTLGWFAGVLASWDYLGGKPFVVPLTVSLTVSLAAFVITYGFANFVDRLRWPGSD